MNTKLEFLASAMEEASIEQLAKKRGICYPSESLGFFKTVYAKIEQANKNKVRLSRKAVESALPTLIGQQVNINHWRKGFICGFIMDAWLNEVDEIEIACSFFKDVYEDEWDRALGLMEQGKLAVSFELVTDPETTESLEDGTRRLNDITFIGVGLLLDEKPAYPGAKVFQMAKEAINQLLGSNQLDPVFAKQIAVDCSDILKNMKEKFEMEDLEQMEDNIEEAKKLTTEERKNLPDDDFAVVIVVKKADGTEKKIRKFPIHDESHVRNALSRIAQDKVREDLKKLGVDPEEVLKKIIKRAKELDMKDIVEKYEAEVVVVPVAEPIVEVKAEEVLPVVEVVAEVKEEEVKPAEVVPEEAAIITTIVEQTQTQIVDDKGEFQVQTVNQRQMEQVDDQTGATVSVSDFTIHTEVSIVPADSLVAQPAIAEVVPEAELVPETPEAATVTVAPEVVEPIAAEVVMVNPLEAKFIELEAKLKEVIEEIAKLKLENDELKKKSQPSNPETASEVLVNKGQEEVTAQLSTGHQETVMAEEEDAGSQIREALKASYNRKKQPRK